MMHGKCFVFNMVNFIGMLYCDLLSDDNSSSLNYSTTHAPDIVPDIVPSTTRAPEIEPSITRAPVINPCSSMVHKDPKRWGDNCQSKCNCRNNSQCLPTGFCPLGCKSGWTTVNDSSPCYNLTSLIDTQNNRSKSAHLPFEVSQRDVLTYSFTSEISCKAGIGYIRLWWSVQTEVPIAVRYLYVKQYSTLMYLFADFVTAEMLVSNYSTPLKVYIPRITPDNTTNKVYLKYFEELALVDDITISIHEHTLGGCYGHPGTGVVMLLGYPVCEYRRWGTRCENRCRCPCALAHCHPVSGSCGAPLNLCDHGRYGRYCEKTCSSQCLDMEVTHHQWRPNNELDGSFWRGRSCHLMSGVCYACAEGLNVTGPTCENETQAAELKALLASCENVTMSHDPFFSMFAMGIFQAASYGGGNKNVRRGIIAMLVVGLSVMAFIVIFGIYAICVRLLARRRLRDYMELLDRQRMMRSSIRSWSELRDEFKRYQESSGSKNTPSENPSSTDVIPIPPVATGTCVDPTIKFAGAKTDSYISAGQRKVSFKLY